MAYGKDKAAMQTVGSFRQRANSYQSNKKEQYSKGGGTWVAPFFVNQYKPGLEDSDTIRILEGHYKVQEAQGEGESLTVVDVDLPFFPWTEHYDGRTEKSGICSAGPLSSSKKHRQPCHGCDIHWQTRETQADGRKRSGRMSRREMFAWSILDYGKYHQLPQIDRKTGQVRRNTETGEVYTNWVKCIGVGCDGCRSNAPTTQGQARHWPMGYSHYQTLLSQDAEVGKSCANCGGFEMINGLAWVCPSCGQDVIDLRTTSLKQDQVNEVTLRPYHCNCGFHGLLAEVIECRSCSPTGGSARRATIFDVDMQVKRVETGSGDSKQTALVITRTSSPRPIDKNFIQLAKPLPLEKIYAPTALDMQAKQFDVAADAAAPRQPRTAGDISSQAPQGPLPNVPSMGPTGMPPMMGNPAAAPQTFMAPAGVGSTQPAPTTAQPAPTGNPWPSLFPK